MRNAPENIRPPAVAGRFYPDDPTELRRMVEGFLSGANVEEGPAPKAVIAPHAGYIYSGPVAASAYHRLAQLRDTIRRVLLLGPSHYAVFEGMAATEDAAFATPLGVVPVDTAAVKALVSAHPQVKTLKAAHASEHSLEVHLPFLQVALKDFRIVPLLIGEGSEEAVAAVIEALWDGEETRFVISSDLSHYHEYARAREMDAATAQAIEGLRDEEIGVEQACGHRPIGALLRAARRRSLRARTLDLRNSGDTAGPRDSVVGYGAFVLE